VEIKSGSTISADMLDSLLWWTTLSGRSPESATLVYGGTEHLSRRKVAVRPWFAVYPINARQPVLLICQTIG
jgi:hypothetical protein